MKKIISLLLVITAVFCLCTTLCSCKKEKTIVGTWEFGEDGYTYTFEKDGTGCFKLGTQPNYFTYTVYSNELTLLYEGNTITYSYTFEIRDGDTLLLTDKNGATTEYTRK